MSDDDTQEIQDARETLELVYSFALKVAVRVVEHLEAHEDVAEAAIDDQVEGAGYSWQIKAFSVRGGHFVRVSANPVSQQLAGQMVTPEVFARVQMNGSAGFSVDVPVAWIRLAHQASDLAPELVLPES